MCEQWRSSWAVIMSFTIFFAKAEDIVSNQESVNVSQPRALNIEDKQDVNSYQSSYFPYQQYPTGPYPPPTYGPPNPPPPPLPNGRVRLEFAFDEIVLRCVTEEPFEHIVWTKHQCPQQLLFGGEGVHVADGSTVHQEDLYDVHIRGHDGTIISELLIKRPLADNSEGIYQCDVWPYLQNTGGYLPFNPYQNYNPARSEVFIIGGSSLLEECYRVNNLGPGVKSSGIANKQSSKETGYTIKPRRNTTETRKDSNSKQLRYNLKYVNDSLYNVEGVNVTADFFRPSKNIPFNLQNLHRNTSNMYSGHKHSTYFSSPDYFAGRNNDKFKDITPKLNSRRGKLSSDSSNTSRQESNINVV